MPGVVGVGGAVILLGSPPAGVRALTASDGRAAWLGELQQKAEMGPLPAAARTGRPMLTADLTRIGPPALAAAAAECGLVSSLALPIEHDGERLGAVQLLGEARRPVEAADGETLRPLLDVLAARLVDVRALGAAHRPTATQAVTGSADAVAAEPARGPGRREHVRGHHPVAARRHAADGPGSVPRRRRRRRPDRSPRRSSRRRPDRS